MRKCILEAHRGVGTEYPEETMAAFTAAYEQGYGMIELDTKFTADDQCVILHDRTVNRTGRKKDGGIISQEVEVSDLTLAQIRELDFGLWKGELFRGEKICELEQALSFSKRTGIPLKFDNVLFQHTEKQRGIFFDVVSRMEMPENLVGYTAGSMDGIKEVLARFPNAQIHYDGTVTEEILCEISSCVDREHLTVWLRFDNQRTSWCTTAPVKLETAQMVKKYARLGLWLLTEEEEFVQAVDVFGASVVETDGKIKPIKEDVSK